MTELQQLSVDLVCLGVEIQDGKQIIMKKGRENDF